MLMLVLVVESMCGYECLSIFVVKYITSKTLSATVIFGNYIEVQLR